MRLLLILSLIFSTGAFADLKQKLENFQKTWQMDSAIRAEVPEFYKEVDGLKGEELLKALNKITGEKYKTHGYNEAKQFMYDTVDNRDNKVFTLYSGLWISGRQGGTYKESGDMNKDGYSNDFVNCEHTWPQSKFAERLPMRSDLHHLYATLSIPNNKRGSQPFGFVPDNKAVYRNSYGSKASKSVFEPADGAKGNVARAQFYFYTRYLNEDIWTKTDKRAYWTSKISMYMKWHTEDPVDEWEKARNDLIQKYQGNRNPFIDYPEFAELIGIEAFSGNSVNPPEQPTPEPGTGNESDNSGNGSDNPGNGSDNPGNESDNSGDHNIPGYYDSVKNLEGVELFDALHKLTGKGYKSHSYSSAKEHMYDNVDNFNGQVRTLYSSLMVPKTGSLYTEIGDANGDGVAGDFVNCEHSWPQSMFNKRVPLVSDLHQLWPTLSKPNGMRDRSPFAEVNDPRYTTSSGSKASKNRFEPCDEAKGNIARSQLYFYTRYHNQNIFSAGYGKSEYWTENIPLFLKWHQEDPVDDWEKTRNERIEEYQGNRNPFIDYPGFVEKIGLNGFRAR